MEEMTNISYARKLIKQLGKEGAQAHAHDMLDKAKGMSLDESIKFWSLVVHNLEGLHEVRRMETRG
jgi:hypothetical protein